MYILFIEFKPFGIVHEESFVRLKLLDEVQAKRKSKFVDISQTGVALGTFRLHDTLNLCI